MTKEQLKKVKANLKHIDVAQRALNCVDVDCLRDYFTLKFYDADNPD